MAIRHAVQQKTLTLEQLQELLSDQCMLHPPVWLVAQHLQKQSPCQTQHHVALLQCHLLDLLYETCKMQSEYKTMTYWPAEMVVMFGLTLGRRQKQWISEADVGMQSAQLQKAASCTW